MKAFDGYNLLPMTRLVGADLCVRPESTSKCIWADTQVRPYNDVIIGGLYTKCDGE